MQLNEVLRAIDSYFADKSRSASATKDGLEEIVEHAKSKVDAINDDLSNSD